MLDLATNETNFIEMPVTVEQPMKDFVSNRNGFPTLESSAWSFLAPEGKPEKLTAFCDFLVLSIHLPNIGKHFDKCCN